MMHRGVRRRAWTLAAGLCLVLPSGCTVTGSSPSTALRTPSTASAEDFLVDATDSRGVEFLRVRGIQVCTTGDDDVRVTGVELDDAPDVDVTGFRVSREPQEDVGDLDAQGAQLTAAPQTSQTDPTQWFTQSCDARRGVGSTSLTVDLHLGVMPVAGTALRVTYEVQGTTGTKQAVLPSDVTVCDDIVGCPDEAADGDEDG